MPGFYTLKASVDTPGTLAGVTKKQVNSLFGKLSASWKSMLFLDVTGRNDWSSSLPSDTRSYFYPSVAGSVVLSEFIPMPSFLDFWKVRGSWTMSKNDVSVYSTNNTYSISTNTWDDMTSASYPSTIRNSSVKPSTSKSYELGTMLTFFKKRLTLDAAYYNKYYYNRIVNATISSATGFSTTLVNTKEEYVRKGVEIQLSGDIVKSKDWDWSSTFNWALDREYFAKLDPDCFFLAEAVVRGWIAGDASAYYRQGMKASMDFIVAYTPDDEKYHQGRRLTPAVMEDFLSQEALQLTGDTESDVEKIITQRYISDFLQYPWDAYYEYRRTGYPKLPINPATSLNSNAKDKIPVRWMYPVNEYS